MATVTDSSPDSWSCPREFECNDSLESFDIGPIPSYFTITSSLLSCLGSLLIVVVYCGLKDMRTGAQKIITLLAVADFISAAGYIVGSINFLVHFNKSDPKVCKEFRIVCEVQAAITSWSSLCSFSWTVILAFYFYMVMVFNRTALAAALLPVYNIIAWGGPLLIIVPLAALRKLGYAPYAASNWCFVKDTNYSSDFRHSGGTIAIILVAGKLWEIISYIVVTTLYVLIKIRVAKSHKNFRNNDLYPRVIQVEKRLLAIPLLFIFLRIWGTLQFFYSLAVAGMNEHGCIPSAVQTVFLVFGVLQAIGDGGQGWGNAILYVFLSPTIRQRLFGNPCEDCLAAVGNRVVEYLESEDSRNRYRSRSWIRAARVVNPKQSETTPLMPATDYRVRKYSSTTCTRDVDQEPYTTVNPVAAQLMHESQLVQPVRDSDTHT